MGCHDLARGFYDHVEARQGQRRTWLTGGWLSFELTECVADHAEGLAERMLAPPVGRRAHLPPWHPSEQPAPRFATLPELLRARVDTHPDRVLYTFLDERGAVAVRYTWRALALRAGRLARTLLERRGLRPGDRVLLVYPPDSEAFVVALWACLLAGLVAVPVAPFNPVDPAADVARFGHICADCGATVALTSAGYRGLSALGGVKARVSSALGRGPQVEIPGLRWVVTTPLKAPRGVPDLDLGVAITPDTVAYLQYTSGSTSRPRGVVLRHRQVTHNLELMGYDAGVDARDVILAWVPWYHDMGLVGGFLNSAWSNAHYIYFSPLAFLRDPAIWFRAIAEHRATIISGPNFGYEYALRRVEAAVTEGLDLSSLRIAIQGGEVARVPTLEGLLARLAPQGVRARILRNVYGLAETVLYLTGADGGPPALLEVDAEALEQRGRAVRREPGAPGCRQLVSSGRPNTAWGMHLLIVDPETHAPCPPGAVGEIWASSPSGAEGYFGRADPDLFAARVRGASPTAPTFLRTGDLGIMLDGVLYVTGRRKELILVGGRNVYPYDLEDAVADVHSAIRRGNAAAFALDDGSHEQLVLAVEIRDRQVDPALLAREVVPAIRARLQQQLQVAPEVVALLPPRSLPKTTSGKLQRTACRARWRSGELRPLHVHRLDGAVAALQVSIAPRASAPPPQATREGGADLQAWLITRLAATLGLEPAEVDPHQPLGTFGLDSLQLLPFVTELEQRLGRPVSPTALYDHPTIARLCAHLSGGVLQAASAEDPTPRPRATPGAMAIIGAACRLPGGVDGPEALVALLDAGIDPIGEVPETRFDPRLVAGADGRAPLGVVADVERFDPGFFGLSEAEARVMDPQQRLLLELAVEAIEAAGLRPGALAGQPVGVFIGLSTTDYAAHNLRSHGLSAVDAWTTTGNAASVAAGRLAFTLDLAGPVLTVDTACSSSLVALQLAVESLRRGACTLALVGGANLVLSPEHGVALRRMGALSPTGRCHSFDAAADGYVRSDGAVMLLLEPEPAAVAAGRSALACVRGVAVNHDGRSQALTAPSGRAQRAVITQALADADATPAQVGYVEAHGTGTPLGDPIELEALGATLGRPDTPLLVGALKATFGHTEAAAGLAGVLRAALALQARRLWPVLHFQRLNPRVDGARLGLQVVDAPTPWPANAPLAGISAFGLSGTNAHAILGPAPALPALPCPQPPAAQLLVLSAQTPDAVARLAATLSPVVAAAAPGALPDLARTLAEGRDRRRARAAVVGDTPAALGRALERVAAGTGVSVAPVAGPPRVGFLLTGQGAATVGMGLELEALPAFREALSEVDAALAPHLGHPVRALLAGELGDLSDTRLAQPALFAVEVALARLWEALGLTPAVLLGHSLGGLVAAHLAGVFTLPDAARLVVQRGALMAAAPGAGAMAALPVGRATAEALCAAHPGLELAAENAPEQVVLSGPSAAIEALLTTHPGRRLEVSHAFHSHQMEAAAAAFAEAVASTRRDLPRLPIVWETDPAAPPAALTAPETWARHLRAPVRFREAVPGTPRCPLARPRTRCVRRWPRGASSWGRPMLACASSRWGRAGPRAR